MRIACQLAVRSAWPSVDKHASQHASGRSAWPVSDDHFAGPAAPVVSSAGGSAPITSTIGTPRLIQFSLKYGF